MVLYYCLHSVDCLFKQLQRLDLTGSSVLAGNVFVPWSHACTLSASLTILILENTGGLELLPFVSQTSDLTCLSILYDQVEPDAICEPSSHAEEPGGAPYER